jgi:hypothetical protein
MLLREWFDDFWHHRSLDWAGAFLDEWCVQVMRSRIEPMKKVARMLRRHRPLILNWFRARGEISAAIVEGFNNKAKLTTRKAYGFRSYRCLEIALYHTLGQLPEPEATTDSAEEAQFQSPPRYESLQFLKPVEHQADLCDARWLTRKHSEREKPLAIRRD